MRIVPIKCCRKSLRGEIDKILFFTKIGERKTQLRVELRECYVKPASIGRKHESHINLQNSINLKNW